MAIDISKQGAKGGDPGYDTSQLRGVREERGIVTGVVKANVHPTNMGVIKIWIPTFSTDEKDKTQWRSVKTKHSGAVCVTVHLFTVVLITVE